MGKFWILSWCLVVSHFGSLAVASPGFMTPENSEIPLAVAKASRSVFHLFAQAGTLNRTVRTDNSVEVQAADEEFSLPGKPWKTNQLEYCLRTFQKVCPVFEHVGEGTAFTFGRGDSLVTNLHNFAEVLSVHSSRMIAQSQTATQERSTIHQRLRGQPLFFNLANNEERIFNPEEDAAKLAFFNPDKRLLAGSLASMNATYGRLSDVIRVQLYKNLGEPLQPAKVPSKVGDSIYIIGFPTRTFDREEVGGDDADGRTVRISQGKVLSYKEWKARTGYAVPKNHESLFEQHMIFADADCEHGSSGGPMVNEQGEVVGVFMALYEDQTQQPHTRICGGIKTLNSKKLKALWEKISQLK